jgi:hypothetical protein
LPHELYELAHLPLRAATINNKQQTFNMKTKILILILGVLTAYTASAQNGKFWSNCSVVGSYDFDKVRKVGILPVVSSETDLSGDLYKVAMSELSVNLSGVSTFQVINNQVMEQTIRTYCFGGTVALSCYPDICKNTGAELLVYCELSREPNIIKKKEVQTVLAYIQIFDAANNYTAVYTAKARSLNPLSAQMELEGAIRKALEKLIEK